jgi:hypothetical protein
MIEDCALVVTHRERLNEELVAFANRALTRQT